MVEAKERLIDVAYEEFYKSGYHRTGLTKILRTAKLTKGAMYHHFASKEELAIAVARRKFLPFIKEYWEDNLSKKSSNLKTLLNLIKSLPDSEFVNLQHGLAITNMAQDTFGNEEELSNYLNEIYEYWNDIIIEALLKAKFAEEIKKDTNIKRVSSFIIASIEGCFLRSRASSESSSFDKCYKEIKHYILSIKK